jgi:hypothetical protein
LLPIFIHALIDEGSMPVGLQQIKSLAFIATITRGIQSKGAAQKCRSVRERELFVPPPNKEGYAHGVPGIGVDFSNRKWGQATS